MHDQKLTEMIDTEKTVDLYISQESEHEGNKTSLGNKFEIRKMVMLKPDGNICGKFNLIK